MEEQRKFSIEEFEEWVNITRGTGEDCEFEVTKRAMEKYLKYPFYENKEWERVNHFRDGKKGYKGAELLKHDGKNLILTADILTSIKTPMKGIFERVVKGKKGAEIKEQILDNEFTDKISKDVDDYIKAFAYIYYWCGNMMPVICSWKPGRDGADTWKAKLNLILQSFQSVDDESKDRVRNIKNVTDQRKLSQKSYWPGWIALCWGENKEAFIKDIFLQDMVTNDEKDYDTIGMLLEDNKVLRLAKALENKKKEKEIIIKEWFENITDLIIRRSYRIWMYAEQNKVIINDWNEKYYGKKSHEDIIKIIKDYVYFQVTTKEGTQHE